MVVAVFLHNMPISVSDMIYTGTLDFNVMLVLVSLLSFLFFLIFIPLPKPDIANSLGQRLYAMRFKECLVQSVRDHITRMCFCN